MIGQTISHYRILDKLGEGGMGVVYKAEDTQLRRTVALKFLSAETIGDEEIKARLIREAQASASLDHPNICAVHGIHEENGETFIAMAYIDGPSLADKIKERPLPLDEALDIATQIAEGLQEAHERGVVHRDIKPSNVMLDRRGRVKIMDFGLAAVADRTRLTKSGTTLGTPAYMSPEQAQGQAVDRRTDIWALGVVLYEMLTGKHPFAGEYEQAVVYSIINESPEPVTAQRRGVPPKADDLLDKALAKDEGERYQHVDEIIVDLSSLRKKVAAGKSTILRPAVQGATVASQHEGVDATQVPPTVRPEKVRRRSSNLPFALVLGAAALGCGIAIGWWWTGASSGRSDFPINYRLTRLTSDPGLTYGPALSPDGKLVAFASDRAGTDNLDIWIKTVAGGQPRQLTTHPADDREPAFSPDSSRIVFRSDRDGGGIYTMSALGGELQLIAEDGRCPRFSPDGQTIAYWVGEESVAVDGQVFVVSSAGGAPRRLGSNFSTASYPVWSPDGRWLLVLAREEASGPPRDWWAIGLDDGGRVKTNVLEALLDHIIEGGLIFRAGIPPEAWRADGNSVIFSGRSGESTNLWRVRLSPDDWQAHGNPARITFGSGLEADASPSGGGRLAFSGLEYNADIFSLPVEANTGKVNGDLERLTTDAADDTEPTVSLDGTKVAFLSNRLGNRDVWIKDLRTRVEKALTVTPRDEVGPRISRDGSKVVYGDANLNGKLYVKELSGGLPRQVCGDCGAPFGWSWDGSKVLHRIGPPSGIGLFDLASNENLEVLTHPERPIFGFQFSPDGRWIAFHLRSPGNSQIFVVPFGSALPLKQGDRIAITDASSNHRHPRWSPNGNLLYYQSERDGFRCIWAQRLHRQTKEPVGEPFEVYASHNARLSLSNTGNPGLIWVGVAQDRLVFTMREITGNIWMMEPVEDVPQSLSISPTVNSHTGKKSSATANRLTSRAERT